MADQPQTPPRPLSPFLSIYRWPVTMATSITHRATGLALTVGMVLLAWLLIGVASGPDVYGPLMRLLATPFGQIVLFGFVWSLAYHFLNGIRHLAWDLGYGFEVPTANKTGVLVIALSVLVAVAVFVIAYTGPHGAVMP